jgi:short-subunit dehydrogenase
MKKKIIVFGSSSYVASKIISNLKKKYNIIGLSKKKNKFYGIKNLKTDYKMNSVEKILKKNIIKNDRPVFLFFNSITDDKIFVRSSPSQIKKIIYINQTLPILITNIILKNFLNYKPTLIYMSSSRAKKGDLGISIYSSTKNAMASFVKNMAIEYGKFEITFRIILLGLFKGGLENKLKKKTKERILQETYSRKYTEINNLSKVLNFAINDKSGNGSELNCDNGYS